MPNSRSDLVILGAIDDSLVRHLTEELRDDRYQRHIPLRLFISSPGGSMPLALAVARLLLSLFEHIETYNLATVDSAAVCLYLTGSKRHSFAGSRFFLHPASISLTQPVTEEQLRENIRLIRSDTESMIRFYRERTNLDEATLCHWFTTPTVFTGDEAVAQGIATDLCTRIDDFSPRYLSSDLPLPLGDMAPAVPGARPELPSSLPPHGGTAQPSRAEPSRGCSVIAP